MSKTLIQITLSACLVATSVQGQIVLNGDLDGLPTGTSPNCDTPAGAWFWPLNFIGFGLCETTAAQMTIVSTSSFDPGAAGNSLCHDVDLEGGQPNTPIFLPNMFSEVIHEADHPLVIVTFDIWVSEAGVAGGSVYVGGDHGGGGAGFFDRGPQPRWMADGTIAVPDPVDPANACPIVLLDSYPVGAWQTMRLEIDLANDNYDAWWAERGDSPQLIGDDHVFVLGAVLDHLDRFVYAHFSDSHPCIDFGSTHSYLDNLRVSLCAADIDGDGTVNVLDLIELLLAFGTSCPQPCLEDLNEDGSVNVLDLIELLLQWGDCSLT